MTSEKGPKQNVSDLMAYFFVTAVFWYSSTRMVNLKLEMKCGPPQLTHLSIRNRPMQHKGFKPKITSRQLSQTTER